MIGLERKMDIMNRIRKDRSVSVAQLARSLYVSEATVRRDLSDLERRGLIQRSYGGAVLVEGLSGEIPLAVREGHRQREKDAIAAAAAKLVSDGNIIILDSSSTTYAMVKFLSGKKDLTTLTNGAKTAISLGELHTRVYATGGRLRENSLSYVGESAITFVESYHADILFFSCRGIVCGEGLYESSPDEAALRRAMMKNVAKKVLLCDDSKLGAYSFHKICDIGEINTLILNTVVDAKTRQWIEDAGVELIEAI